MLETYFKHRKSVNHIHSRKLYPCKQTLPICTTNGYIIDIYGAFNTDQNDVAVLQKLLNESHRLTSVLKEGDIFTLHRCLGFIKESFKK